MPKIMRNNVRWHILAVVVTSATLTACESDHSDLTQYITSVQTRPTPPIKPLPEFKIVEPFVYKRESNLRDPFRLVDKLKTDEEEKEEDDIEPDNGIHPDPNRVKEPLESFPMSSLKMVGTITMNSKLWGLIKNDNNTIYRVKVGDYLGKNDGKITQIDHKKIDLIEIQPTNPGRFIEQSTSLTLTE
jgi:type IV pilus assembly protein PilP